MSGQMIKERWYTASAFGWMWVGSARTAREALSAAKAAAPSASLLSTDITSVRRATEADLDWYFGMIGGIDGWR